MGKFVLDVTVLVLVAVLELKRPRPRFHYYIARLKIKILCKTKICNVKLRLDWWILASLAFK